MAVLMDETTVSQTVASKAEMLAVVSVCVMADSLVVMLDFLVVGKTVVWWMNLMVVMTDPSLASKMALL